MKKNIPTILLALSITSFYGFTVATALKDQEIELTEYLNGRSNANFLKSTKNVRAALAKGTTGKVNEVVEFCPKNKNRKKKNEEQICNAGLKIEITKGPRKGQNYWVYFNAKSPSVKLVDKETQEEVAVEEVKPEKKETDALIIKDTEATRDPEEQVVLDSAQIVVDVDAKKINEAVSLKGLVDCNHNGIVTPPTPVENNEPVVEPVVLTDNTPTPVIEEVQPIIVPPVVKKEEPQIERTPVVESKKINTPMDSLAELNSSPLKFLGRSLMPGNGKNQSCMFENEKVIVVYDNCLANKKEAPATDFRIISKAGGETSFYIENSSSGSSKPISKMNRSEYDFSWNVSYVESKPPASSKIADIKNYMLANEGNPQSCYVGKTMNLTQGSTSRCSEDLSRPDSDKSQWLDSATAFWNNPDKTWYETQVKLRALIIKSN